MKKIINLLFVVIMLFSILNVSTLAAGIDTPKVKATNTLSGVSVTWNKISSATKYVVYKRLGTSSTWDIISTTTGTSYEDKGTLTAGKYYVYSVKAYNSAGKPSDYIKANCATVQRVIAPYTKASNALDGINVTWGKVAGATKYVVLRRIGTESTWKTLCTTTGTSFVDKNVKAGIYYIYSIRAVNGTGYSAYDVNKRITVQRVVAPYTKAVNAVNGINVSWSKVTGANKYVVLRRIGTESTWKTLCTTTSISFLDGSVKPGIYYLYSIRAVNGTGYSAYDVNKRITVQRILTPTAKAVNKSNGVQISWNNVVSANRYTIFRRVSGSSTWAYVGKTTSTTYLDTTVANGKYYAYSVRATNGTGYSAYDSAKCAVIKVVNDGKGFYDAYAHVLAKAPLYTDGYSTPNRYTLYDINKDGTPELILDLASGDFNVFTCVNGEHEFVGSVWSAYGTPLYECNGNGIAVHSGGMGNLRVEYFTLYTLNNNALSEGKNIINTEECSFDKLYDTMAKYKQIDRFCLVNDLTLLNEACE